MKISKDDWMKFVTLPELGLQGLHAYFRKHKYERHAHDYFVLGTIDAGAPRVVLNNKSFVAPPDTAMVINPGEIHDGMPCDDMGYVYSMIYIASWAVEDIARELELTEPNSVTFTSHLISDFDIVYLLRKLHRKIFLSEDRLEQEASFIDAMVPLLKRHSKSFPTQLISIKDSRIERVRELIHAEFFKPLTTSFLAESAALSRVRLNQLFSAAYGLPLHSYLNSVRLDMAKKMLRSGQPAVEVATAVGLADQSHLIRRFNKGSFGITPAQYASAYSTAVRRQ